MIYIGTFSCKLVALFKALNNGSKVGAQHEMSTLRHCSDTAINLYKKFFAYTIKDSFYRKFSFKCPQHLSRVRNLAFLPHLLQQSGHWKDITIDSIALKFPNQINDFENLVHNPSLLFRNSAASSLGDSLLDYRLAHNLNVPSRLRQLYSWNLNSWKVITQPEYKLRKVKKLLNKVQFVYKRQSGMGLK